jgi:AcrR family transcriptional regulator
MQAERSEQILRAFARCIAREGLHRVTLEKVADESGLSRSHVRHYLGNRDAQLDALVDWMFDRYQRGFSEALAGLPAGERLGYALDFLFHGEFFEPNDDNAVIDELANIARRDPRIRERLRDDHLRLAEIVADVLAQSHPHATPEARAQAGYAVVCLAIGNSTMAELDYDRAAKGPARRGAELLIAELCGEPANSRLRP